MEPVKLFSGNKQEHFDRLRESAEDQQIQHSHPDSLICPLCWKEKRFKELRLEHMIPSAVGGRAKTLSCEKCNNTQGSLLDAQLTTYQRDDDVFNGIGRLKTNLVGDDFKLATNLEWGKAVKNFHVVPKASSPVDIEKSKKVLRTGGKINLSIEVPGNYDNNLLQTAVLRSAHLVLFHYFGYEYAKHPVIQQVRQRIENPSLDFPHVPSLIIKLPIFTANTDRQHYFIPLKLEDVYFFLVVIRLRIKCTSYFAACIPVPLEGCERFFTLMENHAAKNPQQQLTIPVEHMNY